MPEGSCCGWPFNEALVILVTTLLVAFPCIEYYSMEALAEHALALRHQHLWCLATVVLHVVSVQLSTSMQMYNNINGLGAFCRAVHTYESVLEAWLCSGCNSS